ncbi:MAG TPA: helix-turn-helix transcriptional regulator [Thermoanaerobaculia bacterium]
MRIESRRITMEREVFTAEGEESRRLLRELGSRIADLRELRNWSRFKLARRLGVPRGRVGRWERGECAPPIDSLVALSEVLDVSLDELVKGGRRAG